MPKLTALACLIFILASSSATRSQSKDHPDTIINYIACDSDIGQPIPAEDGRIARRKWTATWNGNGFQHTPGPAAEGTAHPDSIMRYLTWDGGCWEASWSPQSQMFIHKKVGGGSHEAKILNYLTWDRSKWTAVRDVNRFQHFFVAEAEYKKSKWQDVRKFVDENKKTITVIITWLFG